jgi:ParB/RepB/Spo0J family partition protein
MDAMEAKSLTESLQVISLCKIGNRYAGLRIVMPSAEKEMTKSLSRYGQLTPVVVCRHKDGFELVDGFKRLQAGRKLGLESLLCREMRVSSRVLKAAIIQLNRQGRSISALEEALVIRSLNHDDGLMQEEIGVLLDRHKSWVSRRLALAERLCEEVLESIRLSLVTPSHGRELSKLPRGNQEMALEAILKYRFTSRETERLVRLLIVRPRWEHAQILRSPEMFQSQPCPVRRAPLNSEEGSRLEKALASMSRWCEAVSEYLGSEIDPDDLSVLTPLIHSTVGAAEVAVSCLKGQDTCR